MNDIVTTHCHRSLARDAGLIVLPVVKPPGQRRFYELREAGGWFDIGIDASTSGNLPRCDMLL